MTKNIKQLTNSQVIKLTDSTRDNYTHQVDNPDDFLRLDLTEGICWFKNEVSNWIKEIPLDRLIHYPNSSTLYQQRQLSKWLQIKPECIALGNGSDELIEIIAQLFLEKGDEAITIVPSFFRFSEATLKAGAIIRTFQLRREDGFAWTPKITSQFLKMISGKKIKLVWLANPNNPTGVPIPDEILKKIVSSGKIIVLDQVLNGFKKQLQKSIGLIKDNTNIIILSGFSKTFGLPGLRLGFALATPQIADLIRKWRLPFSSTAISLFLMDKLLEKLTSGKLLIPKSREFFKEQFWLKKEILKITSIEIASNSITNLLLLRPRTNLNLFEQLKKRGVLVTNMNDSDGITGLGMVRVAIKTRPENMKLVQVLKEIGATNVKVK